MNKHSSKDQTISPKSDSINKRHSEGQTVSPDGVEPLVQLWLLRLLVPLEGIKKGFRRHSFDEELFDSLAQIFTDLKSCTTEDRYGDTDINRNKAFKRLDKLHTRAEKTLKDATAPACLARNVQRLSELAGLSATDCRILEFAVLIHTEEILGKTGDLLGDLSWKRLYKALSVILGLPQAEVRSALKKNGALSRSGLLSLHDRLRVGHELSDLLELLSDDFADAMVLSDADPVELLRDVVSPCSPPHLTVDDFPHRERELGILRPYLEKALSSGRKGVNVLLHGAPGTGKTQLAKILADVSGCELFEVACEDEDGDPISSEQRLRALNAAQHLLSTRRMMVLFDEIEDIFNCGGLFALLGLFGGSSSKNSRTPKAWINRTLEENQTPAFWLGNSILGMDPAIVRRFDMIIELPVPPRTQRQKIIRESCSDLLGERDIERLSAVETLAPAVVTRASAVVTTIGDELARPDQASALELIINNTLEAQRHKRIQRHDPNQLPETYDLAFLHTDTDIEEIAAGLKQTKAGRLCMYGPPGTGKTAYGRWLAQQLDVPLLVKRGSDLRSKWVGQTEQNIAACFQEAETEGAILLIDEVEGFLQDRRGANHGWEVSQVNEMLTQMESFAGIFIASTNLRDNLDQAALRRFDMKIKFDYLLSRQSRALLERYCNTLNLDAPDKALAACVGRINNLTPGDFAAVVRRHRFKPVRSAAELVAALEEECGLKEDSKRPIGFCQ